MQLESWALGCQGQGQGQGGWVVMVPPLPCFSSRYGTR